MKRLCWLLIALPALLLPSRATGQLRSLVRLLDGPVGDRILVLVDDPEANAGRVHGCRAGTPAWQDADRIVPLPTGPVCDAQLFPTADRLLVTRIEAQVAVVDIASGLTEVRWDEATDGRLSPDGGTVVFVRFTARRASGISADAPVRIVTSNADGTGQRVRIEAPLLFAPLWAPDGGLYVMGGPNRARIHRLVDGKLETIAGTPPIPEEYPVWADEQTWVYESGGRVWELDLPSGRLVSLLKVARDDRSARLRGVGGVQSVFLWPEPEGPKLVPVAKLRGIR